MSYALLIVTEEDIKHIKKSLEDKANLYFSSDIHLSTIKQPTIAGTTIIATKKYPLSSIILDTSLSLPIFIRIIQSSMNAGLNINRYSHKRIQPFSATEVIEQNFTPLHAALYAHNITAVRAFISCGAIATMQTHNTTYCTLALAADMNN